MRKETFARVRGAALVLGFAVGLACFPSHRGISWGVAPAYAGYQDPPSCRVVALEITQGAGQCPGGPGSQCETQIYTKAAYCLGTCPQQEPYCVSFEKTWQLVYRKTIYEGDCDPPSDCKFKGQVGRYGFITTVCICSDHEPR